jgi:hypothetical protein
MFSKIKRYLQDKFFDKYIPLNKAIKELYKLEKSLMPGNVPVGGLWAWNASEEYKIVREYYLFNRGLQHRLYGKLNPDISIKNNFFHIGCGSLPAWSVTNETGKRNSTNIHISHVWRGNNIVVYKYQKHDPSFFIPSSMYMTDITESKRTYIVAIHDVSVKRSHLRHLVDIIKQEAAESPSTTEHKEDLKQIRKRRKREKRRYKNSAKYKKRRLELIVDKRIQKTEAGFRKQCWLFKDMFNILKGHNDESHKPMSYSPSWGPGK